MGSTLHAYLQGALSETSGPVATQAIADVVSRQGSE